MKKIEATVSYADGSEDTWKEKYNIKEDADPQKYMEDMIKCFNRTLRKNERPRRLISVEILDDPAIQQHIWEKTNLVTINGRNGLYDEYRCEICGITGKRYGLENVIRDRKYRAKCYETCTSTIQHFLKKGGSLKGREENAT